MRLWQKRPWIPLEHQGGAQTTKLGYSARISNHKVSLGENMTSWIVSSSEKALSISSNHNAPQPRPVVHPSGGFLFTQREANHQFDVILSYFQRILDDYLFEITYLHTICAVFWNILHKMQS